MAGDEKMVPASAFVNQRGWLTTAAQLFLQGLSRQASAAGDVVGPSSSLDGQIALFDGPSGKLLKTASGTGSVYATNGVYSVVTDAARLLVETTTISNADILTLPTTPVTIIPAPGPGVQVVPLTISVQGFFTDATYTNINTDAWIFATYSGSGIPWSNFIANDAMLGYTFVTQFFGGAVHRAAFQWAPFTLAEPIFGWGNLGLVNGDTYANDAVQLVFDNNGAGNLTGGHANNHIVVHAYYVEEVSA